jgi:predicted nucleic acid-binding Zn finger protein
MGFCQCCSCNAQVQQVNWIACSHLYGMGRAWLGGQTLQAVATEPPGPMAFTEAATTH